MAITPEQIQDIADPIEEVYRRIVDELLINIGKHVTSPTWTHTANWEVAKLSELGQLTQESAAIINKWIKAMPEEIRATMEDTRAAALNKLEKQMEEAVKKGYVSPPISNSTVKVLQDYADQMRMRLNLVNTNMLNSTREEFVRCLELTAERERQLAAAQDVLNDAAGSVATGVETRRVAMRRAIGQIADEGLTGFYDRARHSWTPEAYVNMVVRTTVHNVAIQSTKAFMQDYNTQVFQVSSHAAARPLCYDYQGKFYSWDNSSGEIELGNGKKVQYEPLSNTTYGQAAGLFGINCGHYPIPIIPGMTIPHGADNIQDKEANDKAYAESQEQRALERKIREAKRVLEMAGNTATKKDKERVKKYQQEMREFIDRTGRTRRYDREQIGGVPPAKKSGGTTLDWNNNPQTTPPRDFGSNGADANAYFGERPNRALRRENREEYDAQMQKYNDSMYGSWYGQLSPDQTVSIANYTGDAYSGINGLLRKQMTEKMVESWNKTERISIQDMIKNIDQALASFELKDPLNVYRTCDDNMGKILSASVGKTFKDNGYVSTSVISKKVASGNIIMQIVVPPGKNHGAWINPLSGAEDEEYEYLLPRGSVFRVTQSYQRGNDTVYVMDFIGSDPGKIEYATKDEVIKQWKDQGIYDEENAKKI